MADCNGAELNPELCNGERGCKDCECKEDKSCDDDLVCHEATSVCLTASEAATVGNEAGTKANKCRSDGTCDEPLVCEQGKCFDLGPSLCVSGREDCACDRGRCAKGLECDPVNGVCVTAGQTVGDRNGGSGMDDGMNDDPGGAKAMKEPPSSAFDFTSTAFIAGVAGGGCLLVLCCAGIVVVICVCVLGGAKQNQSDSYTYKGNSMMTADGQTFGQSLEDGTTYNQGTAYSTEMQQQQQPMY